ncbi:MAG: TerB N-terminal domain-containing protein [Fusobacteriaceae bacterium]
MTFIILLVLGCVVYKVIKKNNSPSEEEVIPKNEMKNQKQNFYESQTNSKKEYWNIANIEIKGFKINDAMIYTKNSSYDDEYSSTVTLSSPVGTPDGERPKLNYWPSYQNLTDNQRAKYLEWLASGRNSELEEVGYIFIFFYGLERRYFIDKKDKEIILNEVQRLLSKYGELSGSLRGYLGNFLIYGYLESGIDKISLESINLLEKLVFENTLLPIKLAYLYQNNLPLDPKTAFNISKSLDISNKNSVIIKRTSKLIQDLFFKKYIYKYGENFMLKVSKRKETIYYRAATSDFRVNNFFEIPNILGISSQFKNLGLLFNECVENLRGVSSLVAKGIPEDDPRYFSVLPEILKGSKEHPLKNEFMKIINESENKDIYNFIKISSLLNLINIEPREKLTLTQSKSIVQLCRDLGYKIEPDSFITGNSYLQTNEVAIFKAVNVEENFINYNLSKLILEIGIVISNSDGIIEQKEIDHLTSFIKTFNNSEDETLRINALKYLYINNPPNLNGLGKKIKENLNKDQIQIISEFIVNLSTVDGEIHKKEEKTLKTLFKAMGVEMSKLEALLEKFKERYEEPFEVLVGTNIKGEIIEKKVIEQENGIKLDINIINKTLANTKEISAILDSIFNEDEEKENNEIIDYTKKVATSAKNNEETNQLDSRYKKIFNEIILKSEWSRIEFDTLVKKYNFMPSAVIEILNEWSDEVLDDFLIEERKDKIIIDLQLLGGGENEN